MRSVFFRNRITSIALLIVLSGVLWTQFNMSRWGDRNVIIWDVIGYYSYLPALVYGDFTLEDPALKADFDYHAWGRDLPDGGKVIQMSSGTSVLFAPFFFSAYLLDVIGGGGTDLDAPLYHFAISMAAIFWLIAGLVFLAAFLRRYFSDLVTGMVLVLLVFGTNLFHYSTAEPGMSHVYSFGLFSAFLWLTDDWKDRRRLWQVIAIGLVFGLIVLVRPTNIVLGIVFLFSGLVATSRALVSKWYILPLMALVAMLVWLPQMMYWKAITGSWMYFSYNDQSFFFAHPHIAEGLFGFRKGWLIYTPLILVAIAGMFLKQVPVRFRLSIPLYLVINIYVVLSWWCWWYGGSHGLRAFIESYAVLAVPLAAFLTRILAWGVIRKSLSLGLLSLLLALNLFQSYQYKITLIHWDSMTARAYKAVFLRLTFPADYAELISEPDYEYARKGLPERPLAERIISSPPQ